MAYDNNPEEDFIISENGEIYTKRERDFKGVWIPKEIYLCKNLSWLEKSLLFEIDSLNRLKGCFASNEYFAKFFGCGARHIQKGIRKLKKLGFVKQISFDGRKRILKTDIQNGLKHQGRHAKNGVADMPKMAHYNSTVNSTISSKEEISVSDETPPGKKVLTSGAGGNDKRLTEKQKELISAKMQSHPFATKALAVWNNLPNVTHHKKPSKTWLNVIKSLNMLRLGKLYTRNFDKDFLKKYNISEDALKFKFKKQEIIITLKKVSEWCKQGFLIKDKNFPTSLPNAIYNPHIFYKSVFLIARSNDLTPAVQKTENKFPEITDYFQKKTQIKLDDKILNQLCRNLNSFYAYHKNYILKKQMNYSTSKLFGDFKSMCITFIDWLVDNDKNRNIDKDFKYSVFGFKPDSIMFKKFIKYYEKTLNISFSPSFNRF